MYDYQTPYDQPQDAPVDPSALPPPPGYHWVDGVGWVPDAPPVAVHNPAVHPPEPVDNTGEILNPGVTPPQPGTPGTLTDPAYYAPFTSAAPTFNYKQFVAPPNFVAPTAKDAENDPGYEFVVQQGDQAIEQGAAAEGLLRSAGTSKGLSDYNRNAAATQYGNVYARAFGQYQNMFSNALAVDQQDFTHADSAYQDSMKEFMANRDTFYGNQSNPFNKLYSLASLGVQANAA